MIGKAVVIAAVILIIMVANSNLTFPLNLYMANTDSKCRRVKEPKFLSLLILTSNANLLDDLVPIARTVNNVRTDGETYLLILILTIINLVINILLIAAVIVLAAVLEYFMWWALLISVGYSLVIGAFCVFYWLKFLRLQKQKHDSLAASVTSKHTETIEKKKIYPHGLRLVLPLSLFYVAFGVVSACLIVFGEIASGVLLIMFALLSGIPVAIWAVTANKIVFSP
ncbi:MAG: hypothetical protein ACI4QI_01395, partial [Candidatus Coproplasma sp.]